MDILSAEDRLSRLDSHWLDWPESWWLRWRHFRAWDAWHREIRATEHHRELAGSAMHEAQFWRNRQLERGKDVSYDPGELNVWLDWCVGGFVVLGAVCMVIGLILGWINR